MDKERAIKWLQFAEDDLRAARACLKEEIFNHVGFHSQQVVEKALKAVIAIQGEAPPKIHGLMGLLSKSGLYIKELEGFKEECAFLNRFYIPTRYPDAILGSLETGMPTRQDAVEALQMAEKILDFVKDKIEAA